MLYETQLERDLLKWVSVVGLPVLAREAGKTKEEECHLSQYKEGTSAVFLHLSLALTMWRR